MALSGRCYTCGSISVCDAETTNSRCFIDSVTTTRRAVEPLASKSRSSQTSKLSPFSKRISASAKLTLSRGVGSYVCASPSAPTRTVNSISFPPMFCTQSPRMLYVATTRRGRSLRGCHAASGSSRDVVTVGSRSLDEQPCKHARRAISNQFSHLSVILAVFTYTSQNVTLRIAIALAQRMQLR